VEYLKEFCELTSHDTRNTFWLLDNPETNEQTTIPLKEWHEQVKSINLSDKVPEKIRSNFNIARNLATYSWFCYSFHNAAKAKAFSALEYALAEKFNNGIKIEKKSELELLLIKAVNEGRLKGSDISLKYLPSSISKLKQDFEQGNELYDNCWIILKICAELINQIFEKDRI
jgi:hypothetical protein